MAPAAIPKPRVRVGGTGVINTPTVEALEAGHFSFIHHDLTGDTTLSQAHFGIGGNIEIGVTGYRSDSLGNATYGNIKYQFLKETIATPALAIGILDVTDKYGRNDHEYWGASWTF